MSFKAVLFDCDGVLVDSETISKNVLFELAADLGVNLDRPDALARFTGRRMAECIDEIKLALDLPLPDDFYENFRRIEYATLHDEVTMIDGVDALLDRLQVPCCVASNGPQEKMQVTLGATGLLPRFNERIFSAYDINEFKPEPGVYLHAAAALGVAPEQCLVVEDSIVGASAGVAAGMAVAVYASSERAPDYPAGVHSFVSHMSEVATIVDA